MSTFTRPENALKKAEELIAVGQKDTALQTLHDVITSKRHRTWSKVLESIMIKYIDLCVETRKGKWAKEGLHQYKLVCQQINASSLETVIKHFLSIVEEAAKDAQVKAQQLSLDIGDLDAEESAESIMLTSVSGEASKDRTDREIVTPWLRFLWETYRTILEILRNNAKMETVYHQTAEQAFSFCLRYQRKNEFRRLSDILRLHLANLGKYPNQPQNINLSLPETLQIHLETRFSQLNVATELELWQEAFRSIEDIHSLIVLSGRPAKPQMMATYFSKLAQIFWVSNNYLFHAYALYKYYNIIRTVESIPVEEKRKMASAVLLAALAIPVADPKSPDDQYFEYDVQKEKNLRMCTLLTIVSVPKRDALIQDLVANKKINNLVVPGLSDLYNLLENKFQPLQLTAKMQEKFALLEEQSMLSKYIKPLQKLTFLRVVQQLSTVYESMKMAEFQKLVSFMTLHEAEKYLVEIVKRKIVAVRIDHQNGALHFGNKAEQLSVQLTSLAKDLQAAVKLITPPDDSSKQKEVEKREAMVKLVQGMQQDYTWIVNRKIIIEKKKEYQEGLVRIQQEKKKQKELEEKKERDAIEQKRMQEEHEKRQKERELKEKEELETREAESDLAQILGTGVTLPAASISNPTAFVQEQIELYNNKKKEIEEKLKGSFKRIHYFERAKREVEKPILLEASEKKKEEDRKFFEETINQQAKLAKETHERQVQEKQRLSRMSTDRSTFEERIMSRRRAIYEVAKAEQDEKLAEIRAKLEEEKKQKQQEAEARRAEEERIRRAREEEDRARREAEEARRAEEESRRKKLDDTAEKQRQREQEAMAKQRRDEEERREGERREKEERREPAGGAWRREERPREEDRWGAGRREERPREEDRWGGARREERPREEDRWGARREERPREEERWGARRDEGRLPPRDLDRDRAPPPRGDDRPREEDRWGARRGDERPRGEDSGAWRRPSERDFGGSRDRLPPGRDDRDRAPIRRDDDRDRAPIRRDDDRDRAPMRRDDDRGSFRRDDDRAPPARSGGGGWRDREDDRPPMRRDDDRDRAPIRRDDDRDRAPIRRDDDRDRAPVRREEPRGAPTRRDGEREAPLTKAEPSPTLSRDKDDKEEEAADGFTTVPKGRRKR